LTGNDVPVSRNASSTTAPRAARDRDVPAATRARQPGWRDPRLWVGIVLVTGSVVAGARILSSADDMTQVWSASSDLDVGQTLGADDLAATRVRFDDATDHDRYLPVDEELPASLTLTRPLAEGELVPAAALGEASAEDTVALSIAVATEHVPTGLARGSRVDVWVIDDRAGVRRGGGGAELVLEDIAVVDAPLVTDSFASATTRQLVLAVPQADEEQLGLVLAASGDDRVRVVGRG
jgi:hypothetical protein